MAKITYSSNRKYLDYKLHDNNVFLYTDAFEIQDSVNTLYDLINNGSGSLIKSINGKTGIIVLTTTDIPEGTNLYYTDSKVSLNQNVINGQTAFTWGNHSGLYIPLSQKASPSGVATLDTLGKIVTSQLPALVLTDTFVVTSEATMLALSTAEQGDVAIRNDIRKTFILAGGSPSVLTNWKEMLSPTDSVTSVNGQTGSVILSTTNVLEGTNLYYTNTRVKTYGDTLYEPIFIKNNAFNKNFGTTAGTIAEGNDSRILNGQTAFGWGNHSGLYASITGYNKTNWDSAFTNSHIHSNKAFLDTVISGASLSLSITGNAATATSATNSTQWSGLGLGGESAVGNYLLGTGTGGQGNYHNQAAVRTFLGLGSNAYSSVGYLPLAGGTLIGALTGAAATFTSLRLNAGGKIWDIVNDANYVYFQEAGVNTWLTIGKTYGNVGMGTTTPEQKLTVLMNASENGTGIAVKAANPSAAGSQPAYSWLAHDGSKRFYQYLDVNSNTLNIANGTPTNILTIMQGGNIGFGTSTPDAKLFINDLATVAYNPNNYNGLNRHLTLQTGNGEGAYSGIRFAGSGGNHEGYFGSIQVGGLANFVWQTYNGSSYGERMRILANGNIGIGTTSPAYKLDVDGTGRFTGYLLTAGGAGTSDKRYKTIKNFDFDLKTLDNLNIYQFEWNDKMNLDEKGRQHYGWMAQEVQEINPNLIMGTEDKLALNKEELLILEIKRLKERISEIERMFK